MNAFGLQADRIIAITIEKAMIVNYIATFIDFSIKNI